MNKKVIIAILLSTVLLSACSKKETPVEPSDTSAQTESAPNDTQEQTESVPKDTSAEAESETQEETQSNDTQSIASELSEDLFSFQIQLNDEVYSFPMTYLEFSEKGWEFDGDTEVTISSSQYLSSQIWNKGDLECYATIANLDDGDKAITECQIAGINLKSSSLAKAGATFILPKNIQFGVSTKEDIIAAYGEPSRQTDSSLTYEESIYSTVTMRLNADSNILDEVDIQRMEN